MGFSALFNSIRVRLQIWYAIVLLAVIGGFAGVLYYQVRVNRLQGIDTRLRASAANLTTALASGPPRRPPPPRDRSARPGRADADRARQARPGSDRPPFPQPPGRPRDLLPEERLRRAFALGSRGPNERLYFTVWGPDGSVLASSQEPAPEPRQARLPPPGEEFPDGFWGATDGERPGFRWVPPDERELMLAGPHGTLILVGQGAGRELAAVRSFAWQLFGSGLCVLGVGLAGGWFISRSITRPIGAIARTASEISASNLSRRIETSGIDRELVGLATILNEMFTRLEAAFERQSRFTSDASHELRTPLAVIHAHAELALSRPRSPDEYRETLQACLKATARMATLVDGLLTLARADAGRLDVRFANVDLRAVVDEVVNQYRSQAEAAHIALSSSLDEPLPVRGDTALLARVSSNLLSNALRYTPEGGRVDVSLRADAQAALLIVEDSGCGIPLEDQSKVFERFFRADRARSRAQGGNGLGLAICKSLVDVHRGSIAFTSVPDRGTRFEVRLPLATIGGRLPVPTSTSRANGD